jgi:hypothetical protein
VPFWLSNRYRENGPRLVRMRAVLVPGAAKVTEPLTEDDLRNLIKACAADHDGRSGAVRFDQRNDGTVAVHPHRRDGEIVCSPESIIAALAISDELGTPTPRPGQQFVAELDVIGWRGPRRHVPDQTNHLDRRPRRRRQHTALHRGGTHRDSGDTRGDDMPRHGANSSRQSSRPTSRASNGTWSSGSL